MTDQRNKKKKKNNGVERFGAAVASQETVTRYGSASAEYIKAYTGVDNELGKQLDKGLKKISEFTVNPEYAENNIRQQAGIAAEVQKVAATNADNIINGRSERLIRTDDMPETFGKNHTVYDHVEIDAAGRIISGSGSQMKFVNNPEDLCKKIAEGQGGGKKDLSRYLDAKINLPSDQVKIAKDYCNKRSDYFRKQADILEKRGDSLQAKKNRDHADKYDRLRDNIQDSGITRDEAVFLRENPGLATAKNILSNSHKAGMEGLKTGAVIGGGVSVVTNIVAFCQDRKDLQTVLTDVAKDTAKSALVGYGTTFAGAALKGAMQQSGHSAVRALSRTSFPTLAISACLEMGGVLKKYAAGEITGAQCLEQLGEKGTGMLSGGMFAAIGQVAIPIPVLGAVIGGMVGYTLSSMLYNDALSAFKAAGEAREEYLRTKSLCEEARSSMRAYREQFQSHLEEWIREGQDEIALCMSRIDSAIEAGVMEEFSEAVLSMAGSIGKVIQFKNRDEFDDFMASDREFVF